VRLRSSLVSAQQLCPRQPIFRPIKREILSKPNAEVPPDLAGKDLPPTST
jgi:hypothetical protein